MAIGILAKFLAHHDNNMRYVALNCLAKIASKDLQALQRHRGTIVDCLRDQDIRYVKKFTHPCYHLFMYIFIYWCMYVCMNICVYGFIWSIYLSVCLHHVSIYMSAVYIDVYISWSDLCSYLTDNWFVFSIRHRALDLIYLLVNEQNVVTLVKELLGYLQIADAEFRQNICTRICELSEKYVLMCYVSENDCNMNIIVRGECLLIFQ